jgi:peptidoglycan-N-acetylglucosamine deacetylase
MQNVTLTFDNGPDAAATPEVLDALSRNAIKATFFVVGERLLDSGHRKIAERAHGEGHWIGNHTFSHTVPLGLRREPDAHLTEIARTQELIGDLAHPDKLFRPFGGGHISRRLLSGGSLDYLQAEGFTCVLWNVVPRDWEDPQGWVETALRQCAGREWPLVVLHDLPTGAMAHLERFVRQLRRRGARFVQAFPPDCVPIVRGKAVAPVEPYVTCRP